MGDAEALLLVDDQQPQILEFHVLLQQLVGADEQIQISGTGGFQNPLLLLGGGEPGEHLNFHREVPKPAAGGSVVLLGKHCGGH